MMLRDHSQSCEHNGQYGDIVPDHPGDSYRFGHRTSSGWCPGGREVTIDPLLDAARLLVDAQTIEGFGIFEPLRYGLSIVDAAIGDGG